MCLSKINKQHKISTDQDWIFCGRGTQVSKEFGILHFEPKKIHLCGSEPPSLKL